MPASLTPSESLLKTTCRTSLRSGATRAMLAAVCLTLPQTAARAQSYYTIPWPAKGTVTGYAPDRKGLDFSAFGIALGDSLDVVRSKVAGLKKDRAFIKMRVTEGEAQFAAFPPEGSPPVKVSALAPYVGYINVDAEDDTLVYNTSISLSAPSSGSQVLTINQIVVPKVFDKYIDKAKMVAALSKKIGMEPTSRGSAEYGELSYSWMIKGGQPAVPRDRDMASHGCSFYQSGTSSGQTIANLDRKQACDAGGFITFTGVQANAITGYTLTYEDLDRAKANIRIDNEYVYRKGIEKDKANEAAGGSAPRL